MIFGWIWLDGQFLAVYLKNCFENGAGVFWGCMYVLKSFTNNFSFAIKILLSDNMNHPSVH